MKYITTTTTEKEIDLEFPYYTKDDNVYYCILSPRKTIVLYTNSNSIDTYISIMGAEYPTVRESEYMNTFDKIMGKLLSDLNH